MKPIIFIHGITGSQLVQTYDDSFDLRWSGMGKGFLNIDELKLDSSARFESDAFSLIGLSKIESFVYGEFLSILRKKFKDTPAYIFRYDWRRDNLDSAKYLGEFIEYIKIKTNSDTINFVTHSMGALVLLAYLNSERINNIEKAILTVPPFWGSIDSLRALIIGDGSAFGINSNDKFRKIARTFPSIYQLVPGYPSVLSYDTDVWDLNNWQKRIAFGTKNKSEYDDRDKLMSSHLQNAKIFQMKNIYDIDELDANLRNKFLILYGSGKKTLTKLKVQNKNSDNSVSNFFDFEEESNFETTGDGIVPNISSERFTKIKKIKIDLNKVRSFWPADWDDTAKVTIAGFHGAFLGIDKVQSTICDWLDNKPVDSGWVKGISR